MTQARVIDWDHLSRQTFGDAELEQELLTLFVGQARDTAARLAEAGANETKRRRDLLHTIKGSASAIGAFTLATAAEDCEAAMAEDGSDSAGRFLTLDAALRETLEAIAAHMPRR
jgi:HPt (histidine-containing phosphotransfer) domain-containing protein